MEEHGVEDLAGGGVEAEGDVGDAEGEVDAGVAAGDLADGLDGLQAVAAGLLLAGGDGEGEGVDEDVLDLHAPVAGEVLDEAFGDADLPVAVAGLALLVDAQGDHARAVLGDERHDAPVAGGGAVAVLEVDGVDHAFAAEGLQAGLDHVRLGGVEHDRQGGGGGEAGGEDAHVLGAVAADVVDAQVEQVGAAAGLLAGDLDAAVVVPGEHGLAERLGAVGVGAFADVEDRGVLPEGDVVVGGGDAGFEDGGALGGRAAVEAVADGADVLGSGAAAAADEAHPVIGDEVLVGVGELFGGEGVDRTVGAEDGKSGVGHDRDGDRRVAREVAEVLAHLGRAGGAVEADEVDAEGGEAGQGRADLAADEHGAGGLDGDLGDDRDVRAEVGVGAFGADDRGLGLEEVLGGLDQERVGAAFDEARGALLVVVAQERVGGVAEGGQAGAAAHGAEDEAGPLGGGVLVGLPAGEAGGGAGDLAGALGDAVFDQAAVVGVEAVGLDAVGAGREVGVVDAEHDVGPGEAQDVREALVAVEVLQGGVEGLQHGAHASVGDHDAAAEGLHEGI